MNLEEKKELNKEETNRKKFLIKTLGRTPSQKKGLASKLIFGERERKKQIETKQTKKEEKEIPKGAIHKIKKLFTINSVQKKEISKEEKMSKLQRTIQQTKEEQKKETNEIKDFIQTETKQETTQTIEPEPKQVQNENEPTIQRPSMEQKTEPTTIIHKEKGAQVHPQAQKASQIAKAQPMTEKEKKDSEEIQKRMMKLMEQYGQASETKGEQSVDSKEIMQDFHKLIGMVETKKSKTEQVNFYKELLQSYSGKKQEIKAIEKEIQKRTLETDLDRVFVIIQNKKKTKMSEIAKEVGITKQRVEEYSKILESNNLIKIIYPALGEAFVQIIEGEK